MSIWADVQPQSDKIKNYDNFEYFQEICLVLCLVKALPLGHESHDSGKEVTLGNESHDTGKKVTPGHE